MTFSLDAFVWQHNGKQQDASGIKHRPSYRSKLSEHPTDIAEGLPKLFTGSTLVVFTRVLTSHHLIDVETMLDSSNSARYFP
jgi:hypothetical protein